jgi:hypothetical protein
MGREMGTTSVNVRDLLAAVLAQLGFAVLPVRRPAAIAARHAESVHLPAGWVLRAARDLEPWEPCLLCVRLPARQAATGNPAPAGAVPEPAVPAGTGRAAPAA